MKILVLHQPFPMGNYRLMPYIANKLTEQGNEVVLAEQLNGDVWTQETLDVINAQYFDAAYYEMLDGQTFQLIEQSNIKKKVLCYASKGIFKTFEEILEFNGRYYTDVLTNSKEMLTAFLNKDITAEFFEYYPAPIFEEEIIKDTRYDIPLVYVGGGFQRLVKPEYKTESEIIYQNAKVAKYGNGWSNVANYRGILPSGDIGRLYHSAKVSIGTIEPSQRQKGMVNNRYSEMFMAGATVASINYPEVDFYGGEEFITFVDSSDDLDRVIPLAKSKIKLQEEFILQKEKNFFKSLNNLLFL